MIRGPGSIRSPGRRLITFLSTFGAAMLSLWALGVWGAATLTAGLLSMMFTAYLLVSGLRAEAAQKSEDVDVIDDIGALIDRCEFAIGQIAAIVESRPDARVYTILAQLAANLSIIARQYRRYLKSESLVDVNGAQVSGVKDVGRCVNLLRERTKKIRAGVRDVDDARLMDSRRRF